MAPSLASKSVDGIVMNQPVIALAEANRIGKTIADLRDLPPKPRWHNHPCCCVAATKAVLRKNPVEVEAFLQAVLAGQRYIEAEPQNAIEIAAAWTRKPLEVEQQSVPTVTYIAMPGQRWRTGMETWFEMMQQIGQFDGALKNLSPKEAHEAVSDYTHVRRAATHLPEAE
jgi:NitT/TauT family transport system substrate-binding protein